MTSSVADDLKVKSKLEYIKRLTQEPTDRINLSKLYTMIHDVHDLLKRRDPQNESTDVWKAELDYVYETAESLREKYEASVEPAVAPVSGMDFTAESPGTIPSPAELPTSGIPPQSSVSELEATDLHEKDLIEEIGLTTETMKMSFLRIREIIKRDDEVIERAKAAQERNQDATASSNRRMTKFIRTERVGIFELLKQLALALVLFLVAVYLVIFF